MKNASLKRILSLCLSLSLICTMAPVQTRAQEQGAQDGLCEHHTEHDDTCGYEAAVKGHACEHEHDDACGYQEAGECTHTHTEECGEDGQDCTHEHDDTCGYQEAQDCSHTHDDACGYVEASEGSPCSYVCESCKNLSGGEENETTLTEKAKGLQELIDALPPAEDITEESFDDVEDMLDEIDAAKASLSEEETEALDFSRYDAAAAKMAELMGEEGAGEPMEAADVITVTTQNRPSGEIRNINLNAAILRPESGQYGCSDSWVYFGKYNGDAMCYRILPAPDTQTNADDCLLLDCDTILLQKAFDADGEKNSGQYNRPNEWKGSDLESWLNGSDFYQASGVFSDVERAAIETTSLVGKTAYQIDASVELEFVDWTANDPVFLLSSAEAHNLYSEDFGAKKYNGGSCAWYTRSAKANCTDTYRVGCVLKTGGAWAHGIVTDSAGISPAFNLDLDKILFASVRNKKKPDNHIQVVETTATGWELTLLDSAKSVSVTSGQSVTKVTENGTTTVTVPYTYTDSNTTNPVSRISYMITDKAYTASGAQVLYYGPLTGTLSAAGTAGTGTFTLPSALEAQTWGTDYHVYIIADDVNGDKETDYASAPVEITAKDSTGGSSSGSTYSISLSIPDQSPDNQKNLHFSNYRMDSQTVTVTNTGTAKTGELAVTLDGTGKAAFTVAPMTIPSLAAGGTATLTITPKAGQETGNDYKATLKVQDTENNITTDAIELSHMVFPAEPVITGALKDATYVQNETAAPLTISASVSDGGTLSYQWYRDIGGHGITGDERVEGATGTSFTPPTNKVGTERYYCDVTNKKNGHQIIVNSAYVTITVTAAGGSGTGGSGSSSGGGSGSSSHSSHSSHSKHSGSSGSVGSKGNTAAALGSAGGADLGYTGIPMGVNGIYQIIEGAESNWSAADNGRQTTADGRLPEAGGLTGIDAADQNGQPNANGEVNQNGQPTAGQDGQAGNSWTMGDVHGCTFRGNGEFTKFAGVKVDGMLLDQSYYTAREGSTIVTLQPAYLNTLATGTHIIEMIWTDGFAATTFTVNADTAASTQLGAAPQKDDVPKTGEDVSAAWLIALAAISGMGLLLTQTNGRKKQKAVDKH